MLSRDLGWSLLNDTTRHSPLQQKILVQILSCVPGDYPIPDHSLSRHRAILHQVVVCLLDQLSFRYSRTINATVAPSPAALAAWLVAPARTSPAAKTPGIEVWSVLSVHRKPC